MTENMARALQKDRLVLREDIKLRLEKQFSAHSIPQANGCIYWGGLIRENGYGRIELWTKEERLRFQAHRAAWVLKHGPIPADYVPDHGCRNRQCINTEHIELVTHMVNVLRGSGVTAINAWKTHCNRGHELTPLATALVVRQTNSKLSRQCRICHNQTNREYLIRSAQSELK